MAKEDKIRGLDDGELGLPKDPPHSTTWDDIVGRTPEERQDREDYWEAYKEGERRREENEE